MKLLFVGHPLIHSRQQLFLQEMRKHFDVIGMAPEIWTMGLRQRQCRPIDNSLVKLLKTTHPGDTYSSMWYGLERVIKNYKPDYVLSWEEPQSMLNYQLATLKHGYHFKLAVFAWQNILKNYPNPYDKIESEAIKEADLLIGGNEKARKILISKGARPEKVEVLLQVGVPMDRFKILDSKKEFDIIVAGRKLPRKGIYLAESIIRELGLKACSFGEGPCPLLAGKDFGYVRPYKELPSIYNKAKIALHHSLDTHGWKEQAPNYANIEANACGLPVIASDTEAVREYMDENPAAFLIDQGDVRALRKKARELLRMDLAELQELGKKGREYVKERFSSKIIAKKLLTILK